MAAVMDLSTRSGLLDRGVYQPAMNHHYYTQEDQEEEEDEEPVHALDLRICKVDESISRYHSANVLSPARPRAEATDWMPPPPRSASPPMQVAFPGLIPPQPPATRSPYSEPEDYSAASAASGSLDIAMRWRQLQSEADPFLPRNNSLSSKIVEAATSSLRFVPYEKLSRPLVKEEPMSPTSHGGLVIKSTRPLTLTTGGRSSFLHHVLQHKAMASKQQPPQQPPQLKPMTFKHEPDQVNYELERRVEAINRSYSHLVNERVPFQDYSPPSSPPRGRPVEAAQGYGLGLPHHDLAIRQRQFLMKLQQHHQEKAAAAAAAAAGLCTQRPFLERCTDSTIVQRYPSTSPPPLEPLSPDADFHGHSEPHLSPLGPSDNNKGQGRRGRPRKHAIKIPLPPLYVFIRNLLHNRAYNPRVISWVCEAQGIFKVNSTSDFAKTWGSMKSNRNEEMTYEKMSRAMRYHYGNEKQGRKGHLAMVKEKRLVYRFGELAVNWRTEEVTPVRGCQTHDLCRGSMCLWRKE